MKNRSFITAFLILVFVLFNSTAWAALTQTQVSQLYVGVFGRASEGSGNFYWQADPSSTSMTVTANVMLNTDPAKAYFGATLYDNQAFIEHIYFHTLGKTYTEDPAGVDYWVGELYGGKSKGEVIAALIVAAQLPENAGAAQDQFNNKVQVSNYCADTITDYTVLETFTGFIADVTDDEASVTAAIELIDQEYERLYGDDAPEGSWIIGYPDDLPYSAVLVFIDDENYMFAVDGAPDDGGGRGMERGTYTWDASTGEFIATAISNTCGDWGLPYPDDMTLSFSNFGNTLNLESDTAETIQFEKILSPQADPIVGSWIIGYPDDLSYSAVLVFIDDENYMFAVDGAPDDGGGQGYGAGDLYVGRLYR